MSIFTNLFGGRSQRKSKITINAYWHSDSPEGIGIRITIPEEIWLTGVAAGESDYHEQMFLNTVEAILAKGRPPWSNEDMLIFCICIYWLEKNQAITSDRFNGVMTVREYIED
jgi:hypothetical protein